MSDESEAYSSDEELQEAFAQGLLKPGINVIGQKKRIYKNDVSGINKKLEEMKLKLKWVEKLDLINAPAPLAPELALQMQQQEEKRSKQLKGNKKLPQYKPTDDPVLNDFRRETMFHRQAQSAVQEGIARLKSLGIATKRPSDYYAEMAKTDDLMKKINSNLAKKQDEAERSERIKQIRQQRKVAKQMQVEATLKKHADKRKMLEEIKKYRKGKRQDLDFLDDKKKPVPRGKGKFMDRKAQEKLKQKNAKFGFGGKKRGSKKNTKSSSADVSEYRRSEKPGTKRSGNSKVKQRPGKTRRVQMKSRK